jgi:hypothetical protein
MLEPSFEAASQHLRITWWVGAGDRFDPEGEIEPALIHCRL